MKKLKQINPIKREMNMKIISSIITVLSIIMAFSCFIQFGINMGFAIETAMGFDKFLDGFLTEYYNRKTYMYDGFFLIIGYGVGKSPIITNVIFYISTALICLFVGLICRKIYLIFRTAAGKTKFSIGETPFQPATIRMVRQISILIFIIPIIELILMVLCRIISTADIARVTIRFDGLVIGLIILALSHFFTYGMEIQSDVNGLL